MPTAGDDQGECVEANWFLNISDSPLQLVSGDVAADNGDSGTGESKFENWSLKGSSTDPISELRESGMLYSSQESES